MKSRKFSFFENKITKTFHFKLFQEELKRVALEKNRKIYPIFRFILNGEVVPGLRCSTAYLFECSDGTHSVKGRETTFPDSFPLDQD
jgi:hypothetical protein